jgi:hypothetical protein
VKHLNSGENQGMKIKISEEVIEGTLQRYSEITLTLGEYGLIRNNTHSFRFMQTDDINQLIKDVDKLFHLNARMEHTLFLIIVDWLDQD